MFGIYTALLKESSFVSNRADLRLCSSAHKDKACPFSQSGLLVLKEAGALRYWSA